MEMHVTDNVLPVMNKQNADDLFNKYDTGEPYLLSLTRVIT